MTAWKCALAIGLFGSWLAPLSQGGALEKAAGLEPYDPAADRVAGDWLVEPVTRPVGIYRNAAGNELILSNGLIRRIWRLPPNGATVALDDLRTGQSLLRGVKPEARVEIDGTSYEIGGLAGQPNYAFLRPQWLETMTARPGAFRLVDLEIGRPRARMEWKRVRHHAPEVQWPPAGVYVRMDYAMPDLTAGSDPGGDLGRTLLLEDDFKTLSEDWTVHVSTAHERSSFVNEGKVGEIYTPANTCVYAERALPPRTRAVSVTLDAGTDTSASWGPGIALVWPDRTVKFNLRPGGNSYDSAAMFGLWDGRSENPRAGGRQKLDLDRPWRLRLRIEGDTLYCDASEQGRPWRLIETVALPAGMPAPRAVRIGKMGLDGGSADFAQPGDLVRLRILHFAAYSAVDPEALAQINRQTRQQRQVRVSVHYEMYQGVPVLSKWITVENQTGRPVTLNRFTSEILAAVEYGSAVEDRGVKFTPPNIHVETDYAFSGMTAMNTSRFSVHWAPDPDYRTQVNYLRQNPCLLEVRPQLGPEQVIEPGRTFESFRTFVMPLDSYDRERNGLAQRRMYRTLAPWVTENPLMMHVRFADWESVKKAIDQCAEVGFEMVILTFGSGFQIENDSPDYLEKMKTYAEYAASRGIEIGGYSLLASRRIGGGQDVVMPPGQRPTFGNSPCLGSAWGQNYFRKLYRFYDQTGFMLLEHDGSYPGDECLSTEHPGHRGHGDSRWNQWKIISDFYRWCRGHGIYLNVPDYYYLSGSNKCGMGYRETNWSLLRAQQVIHTRQNIYDGTWQKTPSMGWMFVPLTQYHGGGAAATVEPLSEHLDHYEKMLFSNLSAGVQACYRGPRLYDTDQTRAMVTRWVAWYKQHRQVLESDLIHLCRASGRDLDYWLHVNPSGHEKALLAVFNPLETPVQKTLRVPLYYSGLTGNTLVRHEDGAPRPYALRRDYSIDLEVTVPADGFTWYVFEAR